MDRPPGLSVRLKLTLSYAGFLMIAGALLLAAVWVFLLRDVPASRLVPKLSDFPRALDPHNFGPAAFGPAAVVVLAFLLVFGLACGWILAGRMLAPLENHRSIRHGGRDSGTPRKSSVLRTADRLRSPGEGPRAARPATSGDH